METTKKASKTSLPAKTTSTTYRSVSLGLIKEGHPYFEHCWQLCFCDARLYNVVMFNLRQQWINYQYFLSLQENFHRIKFHPAYKALMSDQSQQTLKRVYRDMSSFFENLKQAKASGDKRKVRLPRYKPNEAAQGLSLCTTYGRSLRNTRKRAQQGFVLTKQQTLIPFSADFKYHYPHLGEGIPLTLPKGLVGKVINEVKIIPSSRYKTQCFEIHVTYGMDCALLREAPEHYLGIDLGLKNFAACTDGQDGTSFILQEKGLLAYNKQYNRRMDNLKAQSDRLSNRLKLKRLSEEQKDIIKTHLQGIKRQQHRLSQQRYHKIKDWLNRTVLFIARYALDKGIDTVVVGYNKNQKSKINIGRKNNRRFVEIPFGEFRQRLKDRLASFGIAYGEQQESHTSKCSFLDKEYPQHQSEYQGKRAKRGLFKSKNATKINADTHAAANILVKYLKRQGVLEEWYDHSFEKVCQGIVNYPTLISPIQFTLKHKLSMNTLWSEIKENHVL